MTTVSNQTMPRTKRHRKHRLLNFVQTYGYKLFFAHLGKFIVIALYFILLQILHGQSTTIFHSSVTLPDVKGTWDNLLSQSASNGGLVHIMSVHAWDDMRHTVFRGVMEGVFGLVLYRQIGFNADKYRAKKRKQIDDGKTPNKYLNKVFASKFQQEPVTPVQYLMLPVVLFLVTTLVGVPLYLGVHYGLDQAAHWSWLEPHIAAHASIWSKIYGGDYDGLIVGVVAGFAAGMTYKAYLFANTMNYGRLWVSRGRGPKWWMPRPTRQLVADLCDEGVQRQQEALSESHDAMKVLLPLGMAFAIALAVFGYFVLQTNGFTS